MQRRWSGALLLPELVCGGGIVEVKTTKPLGSCILMVQIYRGRVATSPRSSRIQRRREHYKKAGRR
jgi:hypothetical protein